MTRILMGIILTVIVLGASLQGQSGYELLQQALSKEQAEGQLPEAIAVYERIIKQFASDRLLVAKALLQLGEAYQKLGDRQAQQTFERIVREFADQKNVVAQARVRLDAWRSPAGAATSRTARQVWSGSDVDSMGSVSSDGRYLSFTDWATGDLAVRDLSASTNRRLTNTGGWDASGDFAEFSVPSPDGRQVAYAWYTDKPSVRRFYDLRVLPTAAGAGKPRILQSNDAITWIAPLAWMPDGQSVVVVRRLIDQTQDEIAILSLANSSARIVKRFASRSGSLKLGVSPDGRHIAYDVAEDAASASRDIFVLPVDGGAEWPIVQGPSNDSSPMWSPDGRRLLFFSDRTGKDALWAVRVDGGKPQGRPEQLSADIQRVALGITRNGSFYYTSPTGRRNVYVADLDAQFNVKGPPVLLTERFLNANVSAAWSPDGEQVAFYSLRGSRELPGSAVLVIRSVRTGRERDIPLHDLVLPPNPAGLRWFPDGRSVLVVSRPPKTGGFDYFKVQLDDGSTQLLRHVEGSGVASIHPDLSLDGRALYFIDRLERADPTAGNHLVRRDLVTGQESELKTGFFYSLALSPDGAELAYLGHERGADDRINEVGVMPASGGQARVLFRGSSWNDASRFATLGWSRDQRVVFFSKPENPAARGPEVLWRVPSAGGPPVKTGLQLNARIKLPQTHPDGTRLLLTVQEANPGEIWVLENFLPTAAAK